MNPENYFEEDIPSRHTELLIKLKSTHITQMIRYSWDPIEYVMNNFQIPEKDVFRLTLGPLVIILANGLQIGFNSIPEQASVVVWLENAPIIPNGHKKQLFEDPDFHPVEVTDKIYGDPVLSTTIGKSIDSIYIIKREPKNIIITSTPCEAGVMIKSSNGISIIASHGLHDNSDDFSVITSDEICSKILPGLEFLEL